MTPPARTAEEALSNFYAEGISKLQILDSFLFRNIGGIEEGFKLLQISIKLARILKV